MCRYEVTDVNTITITKYTGDVTKLAIPEELDGYRVTEIAYNAFRGTSLERIEIPDSVTDFTGNPFEENYRLAEIRVSADHPTLMTDSGVLYHKEEQRLICCPPAMEKDSYAIIEGTRTIGNGAFFCCGKLTSVTIPDSVTEIGPRAFFCCSSLTSVTIPKGITEISSDMFGGASSLREVILPDGLQAIASYAFSDCVSLEDITIPDGVEGIEKLAFNYCVSLKNVVIPKSVGYIKDDAFEGCGEVTFTAEPGSYAEQYAERHGIPCVLPESASMSAWTTVGSTVVFGRYEQDNDQYNGREPIEWIVLAYNEANHQVLLISRYALSAAPYNETEDAVTWETCTLRRWLNGLFLNSAFSADEQKAILFTEVDNSAVTKSSDIDGGSNTRDRIFLLSEAEAYRYFGAKEGDDQNIAARVAPTAYAVAQGARNNSSFRTADGERAVWWWLRSPSYSPRTASHVRNGGSIRGCGVYETAGGVRPVLWLDLNALPGQAQALSAPAADAVSMLEVEDYCRLGLIEGAVYENIDGDDFMLVNPFAGRQSIANIWFTRMNVDTSAWNKAQMDQYMAEWGDDFGQAMAGAGYTTSNFVVNEMTETELNGAPCTRVRLTVDCSSADSSYTLHVMMFFFGPKHFRILCYSFSPEEDAEIEQYLNNYLSW